MVPKEMIADFLEAYHPTTPPLVATTVLFVHPDVPVATFTPLPNSMVVSGQTQVFFGGCQNGGILFGIFTFMSR